MVDPTQAGMEVNLQVPVIGFRQHIFVQCTLQVYKLMEDTYLLGVIQEVAPMAISSCNIPPIT